jgi:hypothetical protein
MGPGQDSAAYQTEAAERRDSILALLDERPYSTRDLALALDEDNGAVDSTLQMLVKQGRVDRLPDWRWRLTSMTGPALMRDATPVRPRPHSKPMAVPIDGGRVRPVEVSITRLIDGVEFEVTFDGRGETHDWHVGWASSLAGCPAIRR